MSAESKELHDLRQAEYARAASEVVPPVEVDPDVDVEVCELCEGKGEIGQSRHHLAPVTITCPRCGGRGV